MVLINFSHPITSAQAQDLKDNYMIDKVIDVPCQIDLNGNVKRQVYEMMTNISQIVYDTYGTSNAIVLNLPGMSLIAGLIVIFWHMTYREYPLFLQLVRSDTVPPVWNVKGIV